MLGIKHGIFFMFKHYYSPSLPSVPPPISFVAQACLGILNPLLQCPEYPDYWRVPPPHEVEVV